MFLSSCWEISQLHLQTLKETLIVSTNMLIDLPTTTLLSLRYLLATTLMLTHKEANVSVK